MNFSRMSLLDRRYRLTHVLARHDTETHYAARHVALDRSVRLIVFPESPTVTLDEVSAWTMRAAALRHPVLPRVRDCFRVEESICVVMDEPRGQRLGERLRERGPLTEREAIAVGILVADALDTLLRRDEGLVPLTCLTPNALTLSSDDRVTLAYLRPRPLLSRATGCRCAACRAYLAPELLLDEETDVRSDLFSLAAVLRHALSVGAVAGAHTQAIESVAVRTNAVLSQVLDRALARDPHERSQSPAEFASALVEASVALPNSPLQSTCETVVTGQNQRGVTSDSRPTDTKAATVGARTTHVATASNGAMSPADVRTRARQRGRRALVALTTALHISA